LKEKIAIQGIKGSFHSIVTKKHFVKNFELLTFESFDLLVESLLTDAADKGVIAIENSIAGSIISNYKLLDNEKLEIIGETYLNINHNLMALPNQTIMDIKEVHSHPMALQQCKLFFKEHPHIRLVEADDTANFAYQISKNKIKNIAAIASLEAAQIFNLSILNASIQTIKNNVSRFLIIQKKKKETRKKETFNKASLKFTLEHKRGALSAILNVMSDCRLNLTKIQSLPVIEIPNKYAFFVDVTFNKTEDYFKAHSILKIMAQKFMVLGEYNKNQSDSTS